jgi:hypothetical protein
MRFELSPLECLSWDCWSSVDSQGPGAAAGPTHGLIRDRPSDSFIKVLDPDCQWAFPPLHPQGRPRFLSCDLI